jgi:esterase/lipase superfamily enzyme
LALAAILIFQIAGCSSVRPLVDTPNLYAAGGPYPESEIPDGLKSPVADILFVTDRRQEPDKKGRLDYNAERSRSVAFGSAVVEIGRDESWPLLVAASQTGDRKKKIPLTIRSIDEQGRYPDTPLPFAIVDGKPQTDAAAQAKYDATEDALREEIRERLANSGFDEVLVFVPGFNTPFDEAAFITTEIWHFAGRRGVPIVYSWPSGSGGAFGYFTDRESGEFTIYHLKEFVRLLSDTPEIRRINIITHSRGSDVVTTAMRELLIESRAAGRSPKEEFKIDNLIMAAPDLDFGVVEQRLVAEKFGAAFGRITIYTSEKDGALKISQLLMKGTRFGRIRAEDLSNADVDIFANLKNVNFINVEDPDGFVAHSYFRKDPAVLSDIVTLIRGGGAPNGPDRPLIPMRFNFWRLPEDYLAGPSKSAAGTHRLPR